MKVFVRDTSTPVGGLKLTDEGFIIVSAPVAKVGVMTYVLADGSIMSQLCPPETLFDHDSMESLKLKPVTLRHPPTLDGLLTPESAHLKIGSTGETVQQGDDGEHLFSNFTVTDESGINACQKDGFNQLSCGYIAELAVENGVWEGVPYTHRQLSRKYNHLALVQKARGGNTLKFNADESDIPICVIMDNDNFLEHPNKEKRMPFINCDGKDHEVPAEVALAYTKLTANVDTLNATIVSKDSEINTLNAKVDSSEALLKKNTDEMPSLIQKGVVARAGLVETARRVNIDGLDKVGEMDDDSIRRAIIAKRLPSMNCDGKDSVYLTTAVDAITASLSDDAGASQRQQIFGSPAPSKQGDSAEDIAYAKYLESLNAYGKKGD